MELSDEDFREEYKPLYIPSSYHTDDTEEHKVIYSLAQIGEGTVAEVVDKLETLQPGLKNEQLIAISKQILTHLYDRDNCGGAILKVKCIMT